MVLVLIIVFACFIIFAATAEIKQTERVRGYLTSIGGEVKIYGGRAGVLTEVLVGEGEYVTAGTILAVATDPHFDGQGEQAANVSLRQIDSQLRRLQRRKSVLDARFLIQSNQIRQQLAGMKSALSLLRDEQRILRKRVSLAEKDFQASRQLSQTRTISDREHRQTASTLYTLQQQEQAAAIVIEKHVQNMVDTEQQLVLQPLLDQEEGLALENSVSQLRMRRHELRAQRRFTITATRDGIVSNFVLRAGDVIDPREPVLTLLRAGDDLEAWLYLPSRALANVAQDVDVMISYDAYPYQIYGSFPAQIRDVASSAMDPREFLFPVDVREPVYLVKAKVSDQGLTGNAANRFKPGMQFSAEILTGKQTVLQKLVSPLSGLGRRF